MAIEEVREWKAKVSHIIKNGIIISEAVDKHPFPDLLTNRQYGKIRDPIIFKEPLFKVGDVISVKITYIEKPEQNVTIIKKSYAKWISVVYEVEGNGFYTKELEENRFSRIFMYSYRTHITDDVYLNDRWRDNNNPFEVGDVVMIELRKVG